MTFSWFGETAGAFIAPFGFLLTLLPSIADAVIQFGTCGLLVAYAASRADRSLLPLASAAAFASLEWLRSQGLGPLGVPFADLAYTQTMGPLAPLASFVGTIGVTFALALVGASLAYALSARRIRGATRAWASGLAAVALAAALAWYAWPARTLEPATFRVAAIQGDIPQNVKATAAAFDLALLRYESASRAVASSHPQLVVWPETVILTALNRAPALQARFGALAKSIGAELVVGTLVVEADQSEYNVLYFFRPDGSLDSIYRKRQLVPFAERIPFAPLFAGLPWAHLASNFGVGDREGIIDVAGTSIGPIICWESAFGDLVAGDARDGASALLISTDDAWFGTTAGPYQHAQIAQMRALETGRWIVRAASTGISGIIAPNGRYVRATGLNVEATVEGAIGKPSPAFFPEIGSLPLVALFVFAYVAIVALGRRALHAR